MLRGVGRAEARRPGAVRPPSCHAMLPFWPCGPSWRGVPRPVGPVADPRPRPPRSWIYPARFTFADHWLYISLPRSKTFDGSSVRRDFVFERGGSNEIEKVEARAPARAHFSLGRPSCMSTQSDTSPSGPYSVDPTQAPVIPLSCVTRGLMSGRDHRRGGAHAISLNLSQSHTAKSIQYENVSFIQRFNLGSWTVKASV